MSFATIYPSKILLVGEYTVLAGYSGLAIPYPDKFAQWSWSINPRQSILNELAQYISDQPDLARYINFDLFKKEIQSGLYLESNIPFGCGLGSSGTLCAAILHHFGIQLPQNVEEIFSVLKNLEHFFHGQSSGVDPAVAYFNKPIAIDKNQIQLLELNYDNFLESYNLRLIDSNTKRNTQALVQIFNQKMKDDSYNNTLIEELVPANQALIEAIKSNNTNAFNVYWEQVSRISFTLFESLIPPDIKSYWEKGMHSGNYFCKLCGAGGGGYFLVMDKSND